MVLFNPVLFNPYTAILGGILIGLSATILLAWNGRIAGITGIVSGALRPKAGGSRAGDIVWRWTFILGLLLGAGIYEWLLAPTPTPVYPLAPATMIIGGLLVGFGTRLGNGCTSGHGVCGLGRLSPRSLVAVITFLGTAVVTTFVLRHLVGLGI